MSNNEIIGKPGLPRHFAAMFYDAWLVLALLFATMPLMIGLRLLVEGPDAIAPGERALGGAWSLPTFIVMLVVVVHFFAYFWVKNGQTLGMQAWRIRLDNPQHQHVSWKQAYIRCAMAAISWLAFGLGYLSSLLRKDRRYWHDRVSGTELVLLAKRQ